MKRNMFTRLLSALCALLMVLGAFSLSGCSQSGEVLLKAGDQTISTNVFQLMLSRVKGNLSRGGYNVEDDSFWDTVIESDGTVYNQFIIQQTLFSAKQLLVAAMIFDEEGLTLPQSTLDDIEKEINEFIEYDADGSKSAFNAKLGTYGANITALRELYILEAKTAALKAHLYGKDASKIAATVKQDYLNQYAVCFKQILFRNYYEKYEQDVNGDEIYYLVNENNERVNNIAYDTKNGTPKLDKDGEIIVDANKDTVYYKKDGHIAYDTENGRRAPKYDKTGHVETGEYSAEEKKAHKEQAEEVFMAMKNGDYAAFEAVIAQCVVAKDDAILTDNEYCFLYTTEDNGDDYLNDIADTLESKADGSLHLLTSEYGYAVLMKYPMVEDAYSKADYAEWFKEFNTRVINWLFEPKCDARLSEVTVNEELFAALPSMKEIGINYNY